MSKPVEPKQTLDEKLAELDRIDAAIRARRLGQRHSLETVHRLQSELERGSRDSFVELLADAVDTKASLGALKSMSEEDPLKHAQYTKIMAGLAGVAERHEIMGPERLSDAELMDQLTRAGWTPPAGGFPHLIDGTAEPSAERGLGPTDAANNLDHQRDARQHQHPAAPEGEGYDDPQNA